MNLDKLRAVQRDMLLAKTDKFMSVPDKLDAATQFMKTFDADLVGRLLTLAESIDTDILEDILNLDHEEVNQFTNELEEMKRARKALDS